MWPDDQFARPARGPAARRNPVGPDDEQAPYPGSFWAKITDVAIDGGVAKYAFEQIDESDTTTPFDAGLSAGFATVGDATTDGAPAYEVNNNTAVPIGTRVRVWPGGDLSYYIFSFGGGSSPPPPPGTCTSLLGWLAPLDTSDCLEVSLSGTDTGVALSTTDAATWTSATTIAVCGTTYTVTFTKVTNGLPTLTLTSAGSGARTLTGQFDCATCSCATFTFSTDSLCGTTTTGDPCTRITKVTVCWTCCPIPGWGGAGWYCVASEGDDCSTTVAVELMASDACAADITICSGPYSTESEANTFCSADPPTIDPVTCIGHVFTHATCVVSAVTGSCAGVFPLGPLARVSQGTDACVFTTGTHPVSLGCVSDGMGATIYSVESGGDCALPGGIFFSPAPFVYVYRVGYGSSCMFGPGLCDGAVTFTFTDPP